MRKNKLKSLLSIIMIIGMACLLGACSRVLDALPPLPTPSNGTPEPTMDVFAPPETPEPAAPEPVFSPAPTLPPTPAPTPAPTPEPVREDPNTPHLFIENATYPKNMGQYGVADLYGDIYTDKGVIAMVWGRIVDADGEIVQACKYYPYTDTFSLAGTVNAELRFGLLEPGHYAYVVSAIAENNSFTNGEEILIEHPFEIYYP